MADGSRRNAVARSARKADNFISYHIGRAWQEIRRQAAGIGDRAHTDEHPDRNGAVEKSTD